MNKYRLVCPASPPGVLQMLKPKRKWTTLHPKMLSKRSYRVRPSSLKTKSNVCPHPRPHIFFPVCQQVSNTTCNSTGLKTVPTGRVLLRNWGKLWSALKVYPFSVMPCKLYVDISLLHSKVDLMGWWFWTESFQMKLGLLDGIESFFFLIHCWFLLCPNSHRTWNCRCGWFQNNLVSIRVDNWPHWHHLQFLTKMAVDQALDYPITPRTLGCNLIQWYRYVHSWSCFMCICTVKLQTLQCNGSLAQVCHLFRTFLFFSGKITALKSSTVMQGISSNKWHVKWNVAPFSVNWYPHWWINDLLSMLQIPLSVLSWEYLVFAFIVTHAEQIRLLQENLAWSAG